MSVPAHNLLAHRRGVGALVVGRVERRLIHVEPDERALRRRAGRTAILREGESRAAKRRCGRSKGGGPAERLTAGHCFRIYGHRGLLDRRHQDSLRSGGGSASSALRAIPR